MNAAVQIKKARLADDIRQACRAMVTILCVPAMLGWVAFWLLHFAAYRNGLPVHGHALSMMIVGLLAFLSMLVGMHLPYKSVRHLAAVVVTGLSHVGLAVFFAGVTSIDAWGIGSSALAGMVCTSLTWWCAPRRLGNVCPSCKYSLQGLLGAICPECGQAVAAEGPPATETQLPPQA